MTWGIRTIGATPGGGAATTYNQYHSFMEWIGPASYPTGGMVVDLSATYSQLNWLKLAVKTVGANLPVVQYEYTYDSPAAGKATVKLMRYRYDRASALGNVANQPSGVTVQAASGATSEAEDSTAVASDAFTRADSSTTLGTADVGGAWNAQVGTWGIASNRAYMVTTTASGVATLPGVANGSISADVVTTSTNNRTNRGLAFRVVDSTNFCLVAMQDTNDSGADRIVRIFLCEAGVFTLYSSSTTAQWTLGGTVALSANFTGGLIVARVGGVEVCRYQMTAAQKTTFGAATDAGLFVTAAVGSSDDNAGRFDSFSVAPVAHYHSIDHNHGSFTSATPTAAGAGVLDNILGPNATTHTHALDLPNIENDSSPGTAHNHTDNSIYQHQHVAGTAAANLASVELTNATDLSGTTFLILASGVRV